MASIDPVSLQILTNNPSPGEAAVTVGYTIKATLDDVPAGRRYRELVQLFSEGRKIGEPGLEHPVPGGTVWDGVVEFNGDEVAFTRDAQKEIPMSALNQGASPLEAGAIRARVSLTVLPPLSPSRESNVVQLNQPLTAQQ